MGMAETFAQNAGFNVGGAELEIHVVMLKDELGEDQGRCCWISSYIQIRIK